MYDLIVIGGGPAALESAIAARKNAPDAQIEIFSAENSLPYRRPALSGLLAAGKEIDGKTFFIKPAEFFNEQRIGFHPGCRAVKIEGSTLIFENGEKVGFDRLIIASGSNAVRLPIPGAEGERIPVQPLKPQKYHKAADHDRQRIRRLLWIKRQKLGCVSFVGYSRE